MPRAHFLFDTIVNITVPEQRVQSVIYVLPGSFLRGTFMGTFQTEDHECANCLRSAQHGAGTVAGRSLSAQMTSLDRGDITITGSGLWTG